MSLLLLICFIYLEGLLQRDSKLCDIYLSPAQHVHFSQDLCPVPTVEQYNAGGQLTSSTHTIHTTHSDVHNLTTLSNKNKVLGWSGGHQI